MTFAVKHGFAALATATMLIAGATAGATEKKDIVDTAVAAGSFKTLAAALGAADLVNTLKGDGPFTVFAPTDEAFAKLPAGAVDKLLKPENREQLAAILTYHVVAGEVPAGQVFSLKGAQSVNGQRINFSVADGSVSVNTAEVVKTDIECTNGIIHVVDSVLLPTQDNLVAIAESAGKFQTLLAAAQAAGLADTLTAEGPFTVFAPTDEAFGKLPEGTVQSLLEPKNNEKLVDILKYHVVPGRVYSGDALAAKKAQTLQGASVNIRVVEGSVKVNDVRLISTDLDAANGVVHVIDGVLLPPERKSVDAAQARRMIHNAVSRGARIFNAGHHRACADLYMATMREMVEYGDGMPADVVSNMKQVITHAESSHCPTEQSWTLRHGLDHAYARMTELP